MQLIYSTEMQWKFQIELNNQNTINIQHRNAMEIEQSEYKQGYSTEKKLFEVVIADHIENIRIQNIIAQKCKGSS